VLPLNSVRGYPAWDDQHFLFNIGMYVRERRHEHHDHGWDFIGVRLCYR